MTSDGASPSSSSVDDDWGRIPGLGPPLPGWAPLVWFASLAAVLSVVVVGLVRPPGPLDQPDPAFQREGLLLGAPAVPGEVAGVAFGGRPVVLLFDRSLRDQSALAQWVAAVPEGAVVRLVLPEPAPRLLNSSRLEIVVDPSGRLADVVNLPTPVDQGPGIGYAVVDRNRQVQYSTLDPVYLSNAFEIATIAGAVP
jgi:hypothetical protein